jgi:hypothetical protein
MKAVPFLLQMAAGGALFAAGRFPASLPIMLMIAGVALGVAAVVSFAKS